MKRTFSDFKNDFYKRVPDLTLFDCGDINLLKVVLDGLKVNYVKKGKVRSYLFYPTFLYFLYLWFKKMFIIKSTTKQYDVTLKKQYIVSETDRIQYNETNEPKSVYAYR